MIKQLILTVLFGLLLGASPAIAQKGKIRKAHNLVDALDYQSAVDLLLPLAEDGADAEVPTLLGMIFRKQNSYGRAAVWYEKAIAIPGVEPSAYFYYGMMLLHTGKCREAQEQFDYFLSLQPLDPRQFQLRDACTYYQELSRPQTDDLVVQLLPFNSVLSDIGPAFYRSGLVFGSVRAPLNPSATDKVDPFYDLYYVKMQDSHFNFSEPESFSDRINSRVHEAIVTFNADASEIYFTRNQGVDNEHSSVKATGLEIVYAVTEDGNKWSDLQLLPFHSPKYSIAHPSLSPDGSMLFFSSNMPGGFGGKDIYVSNWETDHWGEPVNLGPLVNTEGDEMFPFYHLSGKLYFSSDGQVGMGGQDIFTTRPNKAGVWDNIQNVGAPINTEQDDYGIIVSPDESYGYFTSNRPGGKGKDDIYGFQMATEVEEQEEVVTENVIPEGNKVVIHVQVIDAATGQRIDNPEIFNCEVNLYRSVGTSSFQLNLPPGDCCDISVSAPGFRESTMQICGDPDNRSRAITLQRIEAPQTATRKEVSIKAPPATIEPTPEPEETVTEATPETPKPAEPEPTPKPEETVTEATPEIPKAAEPEPTPEPEETVAEATPETPKAAEPEPTPEPEETVAEATPETPKPAEPEPTPEPEETVAEATPETPKPAEPEPTPKPEETVTEATPETPKAVEPEPTPEPEETVAEATPETPKAVEPEPTPEPEETVAEATPETPKAAEPEPTPEPEETVAEATPETPKAAEPEPTPEPEETVAEATPETPKAAEPEPTPKPEETVAEATPETPKAAEPEPTPEPEETVAEATPETPKPAEPEPTPEPEETVAEATPETPKAAEPEPEKTSENAITVANEAAPEPENPPGIVEETTEIVRQTTRARKTTKYLIGTVYDPSNSRPIPYATIHMLNSNCGVNVRITSDGSGHYRLPLVADCCINIRVEKEGFQTYTALEAICTDKNGNVKGSTSILLKPEPPKPKPKEVNNEATMLLNRGTFEGFERSKNKNLGDNSLAFILNVYYETGRTSVKEESVEDLKKLLKLLEENPTLIVEIGAHTDSRGSTPYNESLSQRRAENVVKYLVSEGINEKRLIPKGYGETQLINDCDDDKECDEAEHQINRRTEFRVLGSME